jgi:hypothetical protein
MHQMFEQLALLADLKRRNLLIVEDAIKLKKEMSNFKVFIYKFILILFIHNLSFRSIFPKEICLFCLF